MTKVFVEQPMASPGSSKYFQSLTDSDFVAPTLTFRQAVDVTGHVDKTRVHNGGWLLASPSFPQ